MTVQPADEHNAPLVIVTTTVTSGEDAQRLAAMMVERRLAACVQSVPIESAYRWDGEVRTEREVRLEAKTTRDRADALMGAIAEAHPYDEPELIVTPILGASDGYAAWIRAETVSGSGG